MDTVETIIEDERWKNAALSRLAEQAARATLAHLCLDAANYEISLLGCDDMRIAALNGDFREKPEATNVLSWPSEDRAAQQPGGRPALPPPGELGDIAIAYETCVREAIEQHKPLAGHVSHLLVHATLHLLGYDHITEKEADLMEKLEVEILATLGLADPY